MKLSELQRVDELSLKQAIAAGLIGAASLAPSKTAFAPEPVVYATHAVEAEPTEEMEDLELTPQEEIWAGKIAKRYSVDTPLARLIVHLAAKNARATFPKTRDILTVIGIESSFNPAAASNLPTDPALGLMQVRPGAWGMDPADLSDVEDQIKHGADILHRYYRKLKSTEDALAAYNVGLQAFLDGRYDDRYVNKFKQEATQYARR